MAKQTITFFSLFTLILVLSIYYIMIPPLEAEQKEVKVSIQDQINELRETTLSQQEEILASSSSTGEEINQALEVMNDSKKATSIESKIIDILKEKGYQEVFCEVDEDTIKITITKNKATSKDASQVMDIIVSLVDENYSPEIKFVS